METSEALASGVAAVVTDGGGPRFIVRPGETGFVAHNLDEFSAAILDLANRPAQRETMRAAARTFAMTASWDAVFESVYSDYERGLRDNSAAGKKIALQQRAGAAISPAR